MPEGDTNSDKAKIEIGMTLLEKNDLAGAEAALMAMAQTTSANKEVFYNLGEVKFAKGETDEAVNTTSARRTSTRTGASRSSSWDSPSCRRAIPPARWRS